MEEIETPSTPESKVDKAQQTAEIIKVLGSIVGLGLSAAFPGGGIAIIACQALLREAPELYVDFVKLIANPDPTAEEKAAFGAKVRKLQNPQVFYEEAAKRANGQSVG